MTSTKLAVIQLNSSDSVDNNLAESRRWLEAAAKAGAQLAVLPENFAWMGDEADSVGMAEEFGAGTIQDFLAEVSKSLGLWVVAGSLKLRVAGSNKVTNTQLIYDEKGDCVARYDKIHLFDAEVAKGEAYRESDTIVPGSGLVVCESPCGRLGASICYDLRFPVLYQALADRGAELVVAPAAFTYTTGKAHWEVLLRARAIENQMYIAAAAQTGTHANGRATWGHAMIIDPWGKVVGDAGEAPGFVLAEIDLTLLAELRRNMPVASHRREMLFKQSTTTSG